MANSLYIATSEPYSGKVVVSLGVMSALRKTTTNIGFFRPIARPYRLQGTDREVPDRDVHFIRTIFSLDLPESEMYGLDALEAESMLADSKGQILYDRILASFKRIEEKVDFVVCEGTDFLSAASSSEDDLNIDIVRHLNIPVLLVLDGSSGDSGAICSKAQLEVERFRNRGCEIIAVFINKVEAERENEIRRDIESRLQRFSIPMVVCIPFDINLSTPRMGEISAHFGDNILFGTDYLHNKVSKPIVCSGALDTIIPLLDNQALLISHLDRHDVLFMIMTSLSAPTAPNVGGIILTGHGEISEPVFKMLTNAPGPKVPIIRSYLNSYETVMELAKVKPAIEPENTREIEIAQQLFETHVDVGKLLDAAYISRPRQTSPSMFRYEIIHRARQSKKTIVLPESGDERILKATDALLRLKAVNIILLGNPEAVHNRAGQLDLDLSKAEIISPQNSGWIEEFAELYHEARSGKGKGVALDAARDIVLEPPVFGTMMVHTGRADGMVAGATHSTAMTIRPALQVIKTRPEHSIVSSVFFMCLEDRVLVYGDCAINPDPNPEQLAEIAIVSAETAAAFGIEPIVAMLSYSTGDSGRGDDVDKVRQAVEIANRRAPNLILEGPLQYDAAVDAGVAKTKMPDSKVGGRATIFIFPDLNTGNNTYKAVQRSARAIAVGPILQGLKKPVNDLSRGCLVEDIINTVAITAIQAQSLS
jgi:phosphate acetyltransferase